MSGTTRIIFATLVVLVVFSPLTTTVYAQGVQPFNVVKGERSETFSVPYTAANQDRRNPVIYTFDEPLGHNWIMGIENRLVYTAKEDAKLMIILREQAPSEKYIEIAMYGDELRRFVVFVNAPEGHFNIYRSEQRGWAADGSVGVTHAENGGIILSDGTRIVVDRLDLDGFDLASVELYGNDESGLLANARAGDVTVSLMFGSLEGSPVYYIPGAVMAIVGATVGLLLLLKKRRDSD